MSELTPKTALLSALYVVLLLPFAWLLNWGFTWLCNEVLFELINWFNGLNLFWKIFLCFFEAILIFFIILTVFKMMGNLLVFIIFSKLPDNYFTIICSTVIYLVNVVLWIIDLWNLTPAFSFWIFLEFVFLAICVLSVNTVLMPWYIKYKAEREELKNAYRRGY